MSRAERRQTAAWAFLIVATLASFWAHAHSRAAAQDRAVAVVMVIAVIKVTVVLRRFMRADQLALPMRLYFLFWSIGCAAMITVLAASSA